MGLGSDGGLLIPEKIPSLGRNIRELANTSYSELAFEIFKLYIDDIPENELRRIVDKSYSNFSDPQVTPLVKVDDDYILELFHGPTLAFKDIALQFLGNVFEYILNPPLFLFAVPAPALARARPHPLHGPIGETFRDHRCARPLWTRSRCDYHQRSRPAL